MNRLRKDDGKIHQRAAEGFWQKAIDGDKGRNAVKNWQTICRYINILHWCTAKSTWVHKKVICIKQIEIRQNIFWQKICGIVCKQKVE